MRRIAWLAILALTLSACGIFEPDERRVIGLVYPPKYASQGPPFIVPESVKVGNEFTATILTGGGCGRMGPTKVTVEGNTSRVTPYDFRNVLGRGEACAGVPIVWRHEVSVTFHEVGEAQIIFTVRDFQQSGDVVEITRTVAVL